LLRFQDYSRSSANTPFAEPLAEPLARGRSRWLLPIRSRLWGLWRGWYRMVPSVCFQLRHLYWHLRPQRDATGRLWGAVTGADYDSIAATSNISADARVLRWKPVLRRLGRQWRM